MPVVEQKTLVIRTQRPWVRRLLWASLLAAAPIVGYFVYELGRFDGGYDRLMVGQQRRELEVEIERLEKANAGLRAKVAELDTGRVSQQQERSELTQAVGDLQTQVARQSQDIAFYRGIVSSTVGGPSIKVQRFQVLPSEKGAGHFRLRVVLVQAVRPDNIVSGNVGLSVEGTESGHPATYALARLAGDGRDRLNFSFRYVQELEQDVVLPEGFQPGRVSVEVRMNGRAGPPLNQSFNWAVQPG